MAEAGKVKNQPVADRSARGQVVTFVQADPEPFFSILLDKPCERSCASSSPCRNATGIGIDPTATTPVLALLVIALATVALTLVAAAVPARRARRVHPATTLAVID